MNQIQRVIIKKKPKQKGKTKTKERQKRHQRKKSKWALRKGKKKAVDPPLEQTAVHGHVA